MSQIHAETGCTFKRVTCLDIAKTIKTSCAKFKIAVINRFLFYIISNLNQGPNDLKLIIFNRFSCFV